MRSLALLVLVAVGLAACGGSSAPDTSVAGDQTDAQDLATPALVASNSPLELELGFASDPDRRQYQLLTMQRESDDKIVQCMLSQGYFYAVGSAENRFRTGVFAGDGSRAWTASNGFGITSSFVGAIVDDADQRVADPAATNLEYVASLTPEQAVGYDRALVGEQVDASGAGEYQPGGCWASAFTGIVTVLALVDEFADDLESMNSRLLSDPRVLSLQSSWPGCMESAGYQYGDEQAMIDDVYARLLEIELVDVDGVLSLTSRDDLDALVEYEQQMAVASFDCRAGFAEDLDELRYDYEREFLDDNRFRIADLQAGAE